MKLGEISATNFLDPAEIVEAKGVLKKVPYLVCGGYENAERCMVFVTDDESINYENYISVIKIEGVQSLSHSEVLGSLLGLGIKREMIGDILIGDYVQVFLVKQIEEYVMTNLKRVGKLAVNVECIKLCDVVVPTKNVKVLNVVVASLRLDAVIASSCGVSREKSAEMIRTEEVKINHIVAKSLSKSVSEGDIISVRHYGRFILSEIISTTRSGRVKLKIEKFI